MGGRCCCCMRLWLMLATCARACGCALTRVHTARQGLLPAQSVHTQASARDTLRARAGEEHNTPPACPQATFAKRFGQRTHSAQRRNWVSALRRNQTRCELQSAQQRSHHCTVRSSHRVGLHHRALTRSCAGRRALPWPKLLAAGLHPTVFGVHQMPPTPPPPTPRPPASPGPGRLLPAMNTAQRAHPHPAPPRPAHLRVQARAALRHAVPRHRPLRARRELLADGLGHHLRVLLLRGPCARGVMYVDK